MDVNDDVVQSKEKEEVAKRGERGRWCVERRAVGSIDKAKRGVFCC